MRPRVVHGSDDRDVARLATTGATSRRPRRRHPARHDGVAEQRGVPGSAPDHGVSTTVDRRHLTTRCRFSSGHAHQSCGQQLTQSSGLNRRPFLITTDVKLIENTRVSTVSVYFREPRIFQSTLRQLRMSAGKFIIVQRLSHMRSPFERRTAGQVRCYWRDAAGDQQRDKHGHRQTDTHTYTNKPTKRANGGIWT